MKVPSPVVLRQREAVFQDVMALYTALHTSHLSVKRAKLNLRNQVNAEPIDFICDVEIKAKRALSWAEWTWFERTSATPDGYTVLPRHLKQLLGKAFKEGGLHIDGDYKTLYFLAKNAHADSSSEGV